MTGKEDEKVTKVAAKVSISGRVQGVWYRASTRDMARQIGLCGWVRNMPDGRVEAWFEGEREQVERMLAWCWKGPPLAAVDDVDTTWQDAQGLEDLQVTR